MKNEMGIACERNHGYHREMKNKHKTKERIKNSAFQSTADSFEKAMKKKGAGRQHKYKGHVLSTSICGNSKCYKSWARTGFYGESFKGFCLFSIT